MANTRLYENGPGILVCRNPLIRLLTQKAVPTNQSTIQLPQWLPTTVLFYRHWWNTWKWTRPSPLLCQTVRLVHKMSRSWQNTTAEPGRSMSLYLIKRADPFGQAALRMQTATQRYICYRKKAVPAVPSFTLIPEAMKDEEFKENYDTLLKCKEAGFSDMATAEKQHLYSAIISTVVLKMPKISEIPELRLPIHVPVISPFLQKWI